MPVRRSPIVAAAIPVVAALLLAGCAKKTDTDKIEQRQNQQLIRMG